MFEKVVKMYESKVKKIEKRENGFKEEIGKLKL